MIQNLSEVGDFVQVRLAAARTGHDWQGEPENQTWLNDESAGVRLTLLLEVYARSDGVRRRQKFYDYAVIRHERIIEIDPRALLFQLYHASSDEGGRGRRISRYRAKCLTAAAHGRQRKHQNQPKSKFRASYRRLHSVTLPR